MISFNTILLKNNKKNIPHKALLNDNSYQGAQNIDKTPFFRTAPPTTESRILGRLYCFDLDPPLQLVGGVVCLKTGCLSGRMSGCDYGGKWVRCSFYLDPWHRTIVTIAASAQDINCYVYLWHGITIPPPVPGVPTCSAGLQMQGKTFCSTLLCITLLSGEVLLLAQGPTLAPHKDSLSFASERQLLQSHPIVFLAFISFFPPHMIMIVLHQGTSLVLFCETI